MNFLKYTLPKIMMWLLVLFWVGSCGIDGIKCTANLLFQETNRDYYEAELLDWKHKVFGFVRPSVISKGEIKGSFILGSGSFKGDFSQEEVLGVVYEVKKGIYKIAYIPSNKITWIEKPDKSQPTIFFIFNKWFANQPKFPTPSGPSTRVFEFNKDVMSNKLEEAIIILDPINKTRLN